MVEAPGMSKDRNGQSKKTPTLRLAALIEARRRESGLSKTECGRRLKMPRQRVSLIERGEARVELDELWKIMFEFRIRPEDVWPEFYEMREPVYKIEVPADAGNKVHILLNLAGHRKNS
jgi:transcriptional regulator with XRE-family HTH domain